MFDISADWPQMKNFVFANISYEYYRALEFVDPLLHPHTNRTRKVYFKPKLQKINMYLQFIVTLRYILSVFKGCMLKIEIPEHTFCLPLILILDSE